MHKEVRDLIEKAKLLGFHNAGKDGNQHYTLAHKNGETVRIPSTPGEWRSSATALSTMERVSGRKLPRQNAAKYSHKVVTSSDFSRSRNEQLGMERRDKVIAEAEAIRAEWDELIAGPITRTTANRARHLQRRFADKRALLDQHCCYIPDLTE